MVYRSRDDVLYSLLQNSTQPRQTVEMMRKIPAYLLAILIGGIIWFFFSHFKIEGTRNVRVVPKSEEELNQAIVTDVEDKPSFFDGIRDRFARVTHGSSESVDDNWDDTFVDRQPTNDPSTEGLLMKPTNVSIARTRSPETIRIGSFHLLQFGSTAADPATLNVVANVIRHFDLVALQGIAPEGMTAVRELASLCGNSYETLLGAPAMVQHQDERFAYIFNNETIIADRGVGLYTLGDVDNLLRREPLVGWFRAKEAAENVAFTFTLVNVNTDKLHVLQELDVLDNAMHEIRNDGREEDDVIMLGSFQAPHDQLGELGRVPSLAKTILKPTTDLLGKTQTENIVFRTLATDEFTGRSGVFQFRQAFNLDLKRAQEISDYLPVWAEFSIYETGQRPGRVASGGAEPQR